MRGLRQESSDGSSSQGRESQNEEESFRYGRQGDEDHQHLKGKQRSVDGTVPFSLKIGKFVSREPSLPPQQRESGNQLRQQ
ncbi:unnamed protein product [Linum trigynum]|uniref:Uncharacterized protein n=1 Tax=Linum trigynum TaxID=586398 RepID=A0AAV2FE23_9ROSI